MLSDNEVVRAIRVLYHLRDNEQMRGGELLLKIQDDGSGMGAGGTGLLRDEPSAKLLKTLKHLSNAGLIEVKHKKEGAMTSEAFDKLGDVGGSYAVQNFEFKVSSKLKAIQEVLGINSLTVLQRQAMGHSISVSPIFGIPKETRLLKRNIFVLMPFAEDMKVVYDEGIEPTARQFDLSVARADNFFTREAVMTDVWLGIFLADIVIADCTNRNVNVFYELGMAHTIGKATIILAQEKEDIPFDIRHLRHIIYEQSDEGLIALQGELGTAIRNLIRQERIGYL